MLIKNMTSLNLCKTTSWYNLYKRCAIETIFIKIPADVLQYFNDEIIILPEECYPSSPATDDWNNIDDSDSGSEESITSIKFPQFSERVKEVIAQLGGSVFLKTNWHCPKDAYWITAGQTLKVRDLADFYQLVKASSRCKDDLAQSDEGDGHVIVFKKWLEIHPGTEFRCFVKNRKLIAVSPRDWPQFHEHILTQHLEIRSDLMNLFNEKIKNTFPIPSYCFDVVWNGRNNVIIIDFSPFDRSTTDALAFDWDHLEDIDVEITSVDEDDAPEFRFLSSDVGIQPNPRNNYGIPKDIVDMFNNTSTALTADNQTISLNELISNFGNQTDL